MLLEALVGLGLVLLANVVVGLISNLIRQNQTNGYFKKVSPNLPVPYELMSIFGGHVRHIVYSRKNIAVLDQLHRKLGKTFGLYYCDKPWVATMDLELIKALVVDEFHLNLNRTDYRLPLDELKTDCIVTAEDDQWKRIRKAYAPGLANHKLRESPNVIADVENTISQLMECFERKLRQEGSKDGVVINTSDLFQRFTVALVFKCFYKQDNLIDFNSNKDYFSNMIHKSAQNMVNPGLVWGIIYPILGKLFQWFMMNFNEQGTMRRYIMSFIREQTRQNLNAKSELASARKRAEVEGCPFDEDNYKLRDGSNFKRNLVDPIIDNFHRKKITEREFLNSTFFLFFASEKTTTDALVMLMHQLASNPEVQNKLRQSTLSEGDESQYLDWCINESFRLFGPGPLGCSRTLKRDYVGKDGILVPKGTFVLTSYHSINRSREYWGEDADEFKPERWAKAEEFNPLQFFPFGLGARSCFGKHFALNSIKRLVVSLLQKYEFSLCPQSPTNLHFSTPVFAFVVFDEKFYLKLSRLEQQ